MCLHGRNMPHQLHPVAVSYSACVYANKKLKVHEAEGTVIVHVQINLALTSRTSMPGRIMLVLWLVYVDSVSKGYSVMSRRPVKCALAFNYSMFCFENPHGTQYTKMNIIAQTETLLTAQFVEVIAIHHS